MDKKFIEADSLLKMALDNGDEEYIIEFTNNGDHEKALLLQKHDKRKLAKILIKYIREDYKLKVITLLNTLVRDVGNVDGIIKALVEVQVDFNKLIYLKGKIDYLKHKQDIKNAQKDEE